MHDEIQSDTPENTKNAGTQSRRSFLKQLAATAGAVVLMPLVTSCEKKEEPAKKPEDAKKPEAGKKPEAAKKPEAKKPEAKKKPEMAKKMAEVPKAKPANWDPIKWNKERGLAGAIPNTYHASITGADGDKKHLGKHLPYVPKIDAKLVPAGFLAIMWGDPDKGYAKHPNAPKSDANKEGHWYNWIKVRKAVDGEAEELNSEYPDWPGAKDMVGKKYAVFGGGDDVTADKGKNTIYLAAIPKDCKAGDTIRIHAHCLTHGEYVDFLTLT